MKRAALNFRVHLLTRKKVQEVNNHNKKMEEDREGEGKILLFAEQLVSLHVKISVKKNPKCENRHLHVKVYLHKLHFLADEQGRLLLLFCFIKYEICSVIQCIAQLARYFIL